MFRTAVWSQLNLVGTIIVDLGGTGIDTALNKYSTARPAAPWSS